MSLAGAGSAGGKRGASGVGGADREVQMGGSIYWANYKTVPNIKLQTACRSFKFRARDMGDLPKYAVFYVESHCDLKNAP